MSQQIQQVVFIQDAEVWSYWSEQPQVMIASDSREATHLTQPDACSLLDRLTPLIPFSSYPQALPAHGTIDPILQRRSRVG